MSDYEKKLEEIYKLSVSFPAKRIYPLTKNIGISKFSLDKVTKSEEVVGVNCVSGKTRETKSNDFTVSIEDPGFADQISALLTQGKSICFIGEKACIAAALFFFICASKKLKKHFLEQLITILSVKYRAFKLSKFELQFLLNKEKEKYGTKKPSFRKYKLPN